VGPSAQSRAEVPLRSAKSMHAHLLMVGFVEDSDQPAFGFLHPSLAKRRYHLVLRFAAGQTNALARIKAHCRAGRPWMDG
jgi:hypothetical protein